MLSGSLLNSSPACWLLFVSLRFAFDTETQSHYLLSLPPLGHLLMMADVKNITHVLNYDFPNNTEDYVHRIGRTGRAGASGTAITLFTTDNAKSARDLITVLKEANQHIPDELQEMGRYSGGGGGRSGGYRGGRGGGRGRGRW